MNTLSALVTIYHGSNPQHLRQTLESLAAQTRPAEEVLLVLDGPIGDELSLVLQDFPDFTQLQLPENVGNGPASQAGVEAARGEFVAKLDADDIAAPDRFATQLAYFQAHPELAVLGTAMYEFEDEPHDSMKVRTMPQEHADIVKYARLNNPVNHPSVMMRTSAVLAAGGYQARHFLEDYDLWVRMIMRGERFHNLSEPLTYFRVDSAQFDRRTGKEMFLADWRFQRQLVTYGLITPPRAVGNFLLRSCYRLLPRKLLTLAYSTLFHR